MSGGLGYTNDDLQLGVEAINQAFEQSPYIQSH
jgi:molybdopterin-biosynthesis enzyme MoeA-like protein